MSKQGIALLVLVAGLAACGESAPPSPPRPVRVVTVAGTTAGESVTLTGQIRARDQANLGFRIDGRMVERLVDVGDRLTAGQVIARLAPEDQENERRTAEAGLAAAQAQLTQAQSAYNRQRELLSKGWTPRARYDEAEQALRTAQAQLKSAQAQLRLAEDRLGYTVLVADTAGVVTAVGAEPGEVVRAGQMTVQVAREGGLDAVFDMPYQFFLDGPENPQVEIALTNDPSVTAAGQIREIAPEADQATRTFQVKVAITAPPDAMRLGATVTGRIQLPSSPGVAIPATALTEADERPAVWTVDTKSSTVSLRAVGVLRYDPDRIVVSRGLSAGDIVVVAGVQLLHPGQQVRLMEAAR